MVDQCHHLTLACLFLFDRSSDSKVKLWDLVADQCIDTMDGHTDQVLGLAWNKNGNKFASVSEDRAIKYYSTTSA